MAIPVHVHVTFCKAEGYHYSTRGHVQWHIYVHVHVHVTCTFVLMDFFLFLLLLQASLTVQDGSEGKVCLHWATESPHPSAPNIVQFLCKKENSLIEAKVSLLNGTLPVGEVIHSM